MDHSRGVPDGTESDQSSNTVTTTNVANPLDDWKPNDVFLQNLTSMGINLRMAKKALFFTNNQSIEAAVEWVFTNNDNESDLSLEIEQQQQNLPQSSIENSSELSSLQSSSQTATSGLLQLYDTSSNDLSKMVFVVNSELSMGVGKIAAQVAHAALGLHRLLLQHQNRFGESMLSWTEYGETKIVLKGKDTNHLIELENKAIMLDLPCYMVHDAGKTQVKSGSTTVLGLFGKNNLVDQVTGELSLY